MAGGKGVGSAPRKTYLLGRDGLLARLAKLLNSLVVVAQILLAANQNDGEALAEVKNLRDPLSSTCQQRRAYLSGIGHPRGGLTFS
jgi:hypothetical protein